MNPGDPAAQLRVAVIGSGVAGLVAAHVASATARVTLFEADDRLGGHADTHLVTDPSGRELAIDTGFIVHNERTYPVLLRLFAALDVRTQDSDMSMSTSDQKTCLEWAGALGWRGLFPTLANLGNPAYLRMLTEIPRFHRQARRLLAAGPGEHRTLREFLADGRFTAYFTRHFAEPLVAAVWSCDPDRAQDYPARYLFTFLDHHGMLGIFGSPQWRTVTGGSGEYVERLAARLVAGGGEIRTGTKVTSVLETDRGVEVTDGNGTVDRFDAVVIATHPGQALDMLAEPTPLHREVLGAIGYSANTARLHTDTSQLPRSRRAWASWNFRRPATPDGRVTVTYDLTRLQRLETATRYLVTLGGEVDPDTVLATMEYEHPLYTPASVAAQQRLPELDTDRIALAGAWHGWGFHEDGAASGLRAAERLGFTWESPRPAPAPRLYRTDIRHTRRTPWRNAFRNRSWSWLVDLDDLPKPSWRGSFEARDHLGDPGSSIRANIDAFLAGRGIDLTDADQQRGRVLMLANPRALGHCFNPLTVFWCHRAAGTLAAVVLEVHNTYGDRHAYLVRPDEHGRAMTEKAMYVSPFHDTSGRYEIAVSGPGERVAVSITLHRDGAEPFTASLVGSRLPAGRRPIPAAGAPILTTLRIRIQGVGLWLRRLRVHPRPTHPPQEGVQ
ncbi:FAD-dependent oxidoreductase [Nocardioides sp. AE5]|uniref:FAD-dependent oxidoreductase n=1 Tax=Nocardioides sp. AE5 TaxID=2962573 RepID=UPI0028818C4D|nr:FAD-dependent oxidoreductase [Nocardioides sp. AE5]MDT0200434.1 FAD-dependent oxidoreductase [Nocardioides sp. AE5]